MGVNHGWAMLSFEDGKLVVESMTGVSIPIEEYDRLQQLGETIFEDLLGGQVNAKS